jgi:hypothetical protein
VSKDTEQQKIIFARILAPSRFVSLKIARMARRTHSTGHINDRTG